MHTHPVTHSPMGCAEVLGMGLSGSSMIVPLPGTVSKRQGNEFQYIKFFAVRNNLTLTFAMTWGWFAEKLCLLGLDCIERKITEH